MAYDKQFQVKVWPIVNSLMDTYIAPVFDGRLSESVPASLSVFPIGVYQSQDGGGKNDDFMDNNGWLGEITMRCIDFSQDAAWAKALEVAIVLATMTHADYSLAVQIKRPIKFPVEKLTTNNVYTAAFVFSLGIYVKD